MDRLVCNIIAVIATFYVFGITYANQIIERIMVDNALHQRLNARAGGIASDYMRLLGGIAVGCVTIVLRSIIQPYM